jgi:hypothetical protein
MWNHGLTKTREGNVLGVFDFFKGGGQGYRGEPDPQMNKETRSYAQLLDEIVAWNIENTDILEVLRSEVEEERLAAWSDALEQGIRKNLSHTSGKMEDNPLYFIYLDLYKFIKTVRQKLLMNPTMKNVKKMEKSDSLSLCIICGIRAMQKERGGRGLIDTLQWMLLERYLG